MALVVFTPRAERFLLDLLDEFPTLDKKLLVADVSGNPFQLTLDDMHSLESLQQDIKVVGPFRLQFLGEEVTLFVRGPDSGPAGVYEFDYDPSMRELRLQICLRC